MAPSRGPDYTLLQNDYLQSRFEAEPRARTKINVARAADGGASRLVGSACEVTDDYRLLIQAKQDLGDTGGRR